MRSTYKIITFVLLLTSLVVKAQFSNYSKYYNWDVFANNNGGGGGSVTLSITNNVLSLTFSGGFTEAFLKQGIIVATDYPGTLPNTEVPVPAGSFFADKGYRFFIINNQIAILQDFPATLTMFSGVLSVNLTTPVAITSDVSSYLSNWTPKNKVAFTEYLSDQGTSGNGKVSITYYDGLGKELQTIAKASTPLGKDLIVPFEYDSYGRKVKDYLPIPTTQNSGLIVDAGTVAGLASTFYNGEPAFAEKVFENSPLDRVNMQAAPGNDWKKNSGHEVKYEYDINNTSDNVKKYQVTLSFNTDIYNPSLWFDAYYEAGSLLKKTVKNEDWTPASGNNNVTEEYTNKEGNSVLVRKYIDGVKADTYYIYDIYGNLTYVIPPLASDAVKDITSGIFPDTTVNSLCFQYKYDGKNRLVEKKLPEKGWEQMIYNRNNQVVYYRDTNLKNGIENFVNDQAWIFTKYDKFGRIVYTGICRDGTARNLIQQAVDGQSVDYETRGGSLALSGITIEYGNVSYPVSLEKILTVNYYDTYPQGAPSVAPQILGQNVLSQPAQGVSISTKSLPLASYIKNIEDDNWTKKYSYYDTKGRVIGTHSINHLGGFTKTESELDFAGVTKKAITKHKRLDTDTEKVITENFEYDNQNRLLVHKHQVDNNTEEILTQNKYNELSQLESKKVGGTNAAIPLQIVDYIYNIRGWLTQINDPTNLGNDLFGYKINYNQVEGLTIPNADFPDLQVKPRYNGNIAEVSWKTLTEDNEPLKRYGYSYDVLNRLSAGFYQKAGSETAKEYFEKIDYDLNGNVTRLKRSGGLLQGSTTALAIDNLKYDYTGNKLTKVTDEQQNASGYPYIVTPFEITYDDNGNMIRHRDKGLELIEYNYLNLPSKMTGASGKNQKKYNYLYRADGAKVSKTYYSRATEAWTTDYLDGFQYRFYTGPTPPITNSDLKFVPTSEGYYDFENNSYIYNYTDHLGNVRLSYTDTNKDGIIQPRQYHYQQCDGVFNPPFELPVCIDGWRPGEIVEVNNYYPFGLLHNYTVTTQNPYQHKYNGKELQETGMYDYGARFYMPDLGRWSVIDPLTEKMTRYSPYNYAFDNPVRFIDPDGRAPLDDHFNKNGRFMYRDNKKTNNIIVHTDQGNAKLSQLDYSKQGTRKAVSNIIAHYAGQKGLSGIYGVSTKIENEDTGAQTSRKRGSVFYNSKQLAKGSYDNLYDLRNTLDHEAGKDGHKSEPKGITYTYLAHAKVYLGQSKTSDYVNSTEGNQNSVAFGFAERLWNAYKNKEISWDGMNPYLDDFNKNKGGVTISTIGGYEGDPMEVGIQNDNQQFAPKAVEKLKNPNE